MFGSHTKSFHPGRAAQSGLLAACMAQGGYTSSAQALEAKRGWANVVGATKSNVLESLERWLGSRREYRRLAHAGEGRWEILRIVSNRTHAVLSFILSSMLALILTASF